MTCNCITWQKLRSKGRSEVWWEREGGWFYPILLKSTWQRGKAQLPQCTGCQTINFWHVTKGIWEKGETTKKIIIYQLKIMNELVLSWKCCPASKTTWKIATKQSVYFGYSLCNGYYLLCVGQNLILEVLSVARIFFLWFRQCTGMAWDKDGDTLAIIQDKNGNNTVIIFKLAVVSSK